MKRLFVHLFYLLSVLTGTAVAAAPGVVAGAQDSGFREAVELWLADDDARSLPLMAKLAREDNRAARLLLARIEFTDRAPSAFVLALDRQQRNELYRGQREGSRFRPSWIRIEAENGDPFAVTLRRAGELGIDIDTVRQLYALGEVQAAEHQIRKVAVDGSQTERKRLAEFLGPEDELAPYLRGFRFASSGETTGRTAMQAIIGQLESKSVAELTDDADTRRALIFVDIGYQAGRQVADYDAQGRHFDTLVQWLSSAPVASPIAHLCKLQCGVDEQPMCMLTAFGLVGGYYELLRFDSPLETLIPQAQFLASRRATGMVARRVSSARSEAAVPVFAAGDLKQRSACLAATLAGRE